MNTSVVRSLALHFGLGLTFVLVDQWSGHFSKQTKKVEFTVIEVPKLAPRAMDLTPPKLPDKLPPAPAQAQKKVFGISKSTLTATASNNSESVAVKAGNTVATAPDNLKFDDAETSLPIPADEFLISEMPRLLSDVRVAYPEAAKKAGVEGVVVLDLLIDADGRVRDAKVLKPLGYGLDEAALMAAKSFKFSAGKIDGKGVAVRIHYNYRFVLEKS